MSDIKEEKKIDLEEEVIEDSNETKKEPSKEKSKSRAIQVRRYRPLSLFGNIDSMFDDLDRYFENFWKPSRFWNFEPLNVRLFNDDEFFRSPLTNIKDNGDKYKISAELPGLDKGDIEIMIHDGMLEIKGEQKEKHEEKKNGYVRKEYHSSSYHRSFNIPEDVDEDKIDAKLDKGILTLDLPKKELEKKEKKKIEVK
ncbi:MAG: Hsp20/alpha crystallin family protein [Promethearchaeota archaeon]|jgi:HSP20 family protein